MRAAVLAATLALALALTACGGGGESTNGEAPAPTAAATAPQPMPTGAGAKEPGNDPSAKGRPPGPSTGGSVSPRSAPFRGSSGPLKNLPRYGAEAGAGQRRQAQLLLTGYLDAAAKRKWGSACGYLAAEFLAQVRQLAVGAAPPPPGWCAEALPAFLAAAGRPPGELRRFAGSEVASLRVEGDAAFALIHGEGVEKLWVAMKRRGGEWRLLTPVPQRL